MKLLPYAIVLLTATAHGQVKSDEEVVLFNTWACQETESREWLVPIHGWIFEPEADSMRRKLLIVGLTELLEKQRRISSQSEELLAHRIRCFVVDSERGKHVPIRAAGEILTIGPSSMDGHFAAMLRLAPDRVPTTNTQKAASCDWMQVTVADETDIRRFSAGAVQLLGREGLSVISDIDDTIKLTHVSDTEEMLANTLLRPFEPIRGMAEVYQKWEQVGATFHYISDSPWQLYRDIVDFMETHRFPIGSFDLRSFRLIGTSLNDLFDDPASSKPTQVEALLKSLPERQYILVGDSGQKDPEVYGDIARKYPAQVLRIFIRNCSDEKADSDRFIVAFRDIPRDQWMLFDDPAQLRRINLAAITSSQRVTTTQPEHPPAR